MELNKYKITIVSRKDNKVTVAKSVLAKSEAEAISHFKYNIFEYKILKVEEE